MAEACSRDRWAHTSSLLAMLANVNRDPKKCRVFKPEDFDPHERRKRDEREKRSVAMKRGSFDILRKVFIDGPKRAGKGSQS
ncbi:MAG: hypothetical protein HZA50_14970 [Planctomycetes bacterium]|nr:hypothetical protein [Planctomycetota bacterium]